MPFNNGIEISTTAMSGPSSSQYLIASRPSEAAPTTSKPSSFRIARNPSRTIAWSSAIKSRQTSPPVCGISTPLPQLASVDREKRGWYSRLAPQDCGLSATASACGLERCGIVASDRLDSRSLGRATFQTDPLALIELNEGLRPD